MPRIPEKPILPLILNRWSPRAMSGEPLSEEEFLPLFEAARWAPSCYNSQPWRFLYAKQGTPHFEAFFDFLVAFNQKWCKKAALLVVILSRKHFEKTGKPSPTHAFDTGAAWENLFLEGVHRGLVVHGMGGFSREKVVETLHIPPEYEVLAMAAIGKKGKTEELAEDLIPLEKPSDRKPLKSIAFEGVLPPDAVF